MSLFSFSGHMGMRLFQPFIMLLALQGQVQFRARFSFRFMRTCMVYFNYYTRQIDTSTRYVLACRRFNPICRCCVVITEIINVVRDNVQKVGAFLSPES